MKAFLFSSVAVVLLVALIVINGIYLSKVTDELEKMALELTEGDTDAVLSLQEYWKGHENIVCFSVSHNDVDDLNIAIEVIIEKCKSGEVDGFYEYKARLLNSIVEIRNKERVHFHNIL